MSGAHAHPRTPAPPLRVDSHGLLWLAGLVAGIAACKAWVHFQGARAVHEAMGIVREAAQTRE